MVEMHLLSVNADFRYDEIYGLGVVTAFVRFMQGYRPETDKDSIFNALCHSIQHEPSQYHQSAEQLRLLASQTSVESLLSQLNHLESAEPHGLAGSLKSIADNPHFKYSRLFAIGLYTLLEMMNPEVVKDDKRRTEVLQQICQVLHIPQEKLQKDLELYRSNLDKIAQAQIVMQDMLQADRKKKEERARARDAIATPPSTSSDSP